MPVSTWKWHISPNLSVTTLQIIANTEPTTLMLNVFISPVQFIVFDSFSCLYWKCNVPKSCCSASAVPNLGIAPTLWSVSSSSGYYSSQIGAFIVWKIFLSNRSIFLFWVPVGVQISNDITGFIKAGFIFIMSFLEFLQDFNTFLREKKALFLLVIPWYISYHYSFIEIIVEARYLNLSNLGNNFPFMQILQFGWDFWLIVMYSVPSPLNFYLCFFSYQSLI